MREVLRAPTDALLAKGQVGQDRVRQMHDAAKNAALITQAIRESRPLTYTR
jgi:hypothetical protein